MPYLNSCRTEENGWNYIKTDRTNPKQINFYSNFTFHAYIYLLLINSYVNLHLQIQLISSNFILIN